MQILAYCGIVPSLPRAWPVIPGAAANIFRWRRRLLHTLFRFLVFLRGAVFVVLRIDDSGASDQGTASVKRLQSLRI
jgi:hypothetical protein